MTPEEEAEFAHVYEHLHASNEGVCVDPMCGCNGRIGGGGGGKPGPSFWGIGGWVSTGGGQTMTPAESWTRIARSVPVATLIVWSLIAMVLVAATVCTILMQWGM